jgi:hypothetical protein
VAALAMAPISGCSDDNGSSAGDDSGPAASSSQSDAKGGHFTFYAIDRSTRSTGTERLDLLDWQTDSAGKLSGTWVSVSLSKDPGQSEPDLREKSRITGTQNGKTIEFTIPEDSDIPTRHGKINGKTLKMEGDLAAQSDTFKAISKKGFEKLVDKDLSTLPSPSPTSSPSGFEPGGV